MKQLLIASLLLVPPTAAFGQLSRLVYLEDLEDEEGVIEISSLDAPLGRDLAPVGDVDGDGLEDVLLGAAAAGRVFLIYGQTGLPSKLDPFAGGARMSVIDIDVAANENPSVELGGGADVNGDGLRDFLVGCERRTALVFGSRTLTDSFAIDDVGRSVPGVQIQFLRHLDRYTGLGSQTASLGGDLNGDGIGEVLLGDPEWSPEAPGKGIAYVVFGSRNLPATIELEAIGGKVPGFVVTGMRPDDRVPTGDEIGMSVQYSGDVDGDGFGDLGISGNTCAQGSYLVFGRSQTPPLLEVDQIAGQYGIYFDRMGGPMRSLGDFNGDGRAEFTLQHGGSSYDLVIVGGRPRDRFTAVVRPEQLLSGDPLNTVIREPMTHHLCPPLLPLAGGADVDGDGRADLVLGRDTGSLQIPDDPNTGQKKPESPGVVYFLPTPRGLPSDLSIQELRAVWGYSIVGKPDDVLGEGYTFTVGGVLEPRHRNLGLLSEFDGDGSGELLLGAPGRAYLIPPRSLLDPALEITAVSPDSGNTGGGDLVRVTGRGLAPGTRFFIGGAEARPVSAETQRTAVLEVPAWAGGPLTVDIKAIRGGRDSVLAGAFQYREERIIDVSDISSGLVPGGELVRAGGDTIIDTVDIVRDVSGDGIDDIVIFWDGEGERNSVVFGGPHIAGRDDFSIAERGFTLPRPRSVEGPNGDSYIARLVGSGDIDGDGIGDLAVWTFSLRPPDFAIVSWLHVLYGGPDLPTLTHPASFPRRTRIGPFTDPGLGIHHIVRDLDGGGRDDLVVTKYDLRAESCGESQGANNSFWLIRGEDLKDIHDVDLGVLPKRLIRTKFQRIDTFQSLDANGDGQPDLALEAKACDHEGLLVLFGGAHLAGRGELFVDDAYLDGGGRGLGIAGRAYPPEWPSLGFRLSSMADLNGDGADELVAGSPFIDSEDGLREAGEAYVVSVKQGLSPPAASDYVREWAEEFGITPAYLLNPVAAEKGYLALNGGLADRQASRSIAGIGDLNGDGMPDLAIGEGVFPATDCPGGCPDGRQIGVPYTYVVFGESGLLEGQALNIRADIKHGLKVRGAGYCLAGGSDVSGDGFADLVLARRGGSVYVLFGGPQLGTIRFRRGDVDLNEKLEISDAIRLLGYLFLGDDRPRCLDAGDVDDDGELGISDAIRLLGYLFLGGAAPEPPFPEPDTDPTSDRLGCGEG